MAVEYSLTAILCRNCTNFYHPKFQIFTGFLILPSLRSISCEYNIKYLSKIFNIDIWPMSKAAIDGRGCCFFMFGRRYEGRMWLIQPINMVCEEKEVCPCASLPVCSCASSMLPVCFFTRVPVCYLPFARVPFPSPG
jgi:hypothetical protein